MLSQLIPLSHTTTVVSVPVRPTDQPLFAWAAYIASDNALSSVRKEGDPWLQVTTRAKLDYYLYKHILTAFRLLGSCRDHLNSRHTGSPQLSCGHKHTSAQTRVHRRAHLVR